MQYWWILVGSQAYNEYVVFFCFVIRKSGEMGRAKPTILYELILFSRANVDT